MTRATVLAALIAACGDNSSFVPPEIAAGPVIITTDPLTIVLGDTGVETTLAIGVVDGGVVPEKYYDPRDLDQVTWQRPARAVDADGEWLILEGGARIRLVADPVSQSASLDVDASEIENAALVQLALTRLPGEPIYGFGESLGGADASGQVREAQFRVDLEYESSLNEAHVPVPLALWPRRGAGLFVEDRRSGAFDVGARDQTLLTATFNLPDRGAYRSHLFTAPRGDPLELVRRYVDLTVPPALPPRWAFGNMQWRNENASADEVRGDAMAMRTLGIANTVMWIDNPWQTGYNTFVFDETRIADPEQLIADLTAQGMKVLVWSTPYVDVAGVTAGDYAEAAANQFLVADDTGQPIVFPWQNGPGGLLDFTRDGATAWWRERIGRVVDIGISGFKLDFGEDVVPELGGNLAPLYLAAGDAQEMHGRYQRYYHDAYLGALPPDDGFLLTRAGAWGTQDVNTAIWPGDLDNDFSRHGVDNGMGDLNVGGLPAAVACGLSLSVSGFPFFGSDIGGFRGGTPTTESLIRWSQYAALGTIMQLGGAGPSHNPWDTTLYQAPALAVYTEYARLHMDLNPYIWSLAQIASADGTPVTRPARFVFDCACDDAMFLVGDAILVAPVIEAGATTRAAILPARDWSDWWTDAITSGDGQTAITAAAPLTRMPIWQRVGSIVPMFTRAADTLVPATALGVRSYAEPFYGRELRLRIVPGPGPIDVALHDGGDGYYTPGTTRGLRYTPGAQYDIITFDVHEAGIEAVTAVTAGAATLPRVNTETALLACASPGCWHRQAGRVQVRLFARDASTATMAF